MYFLLKNIVAIIIKHLTGAFTSTCYNWEDDTASIFLVVGPIFCSYKNILGEIELKCMWLGLYHDLLNITITNQVKLTSFRCFFLQKPIFSNQGYVCDLILGILPISGGTTTKWNISASFGVWLYLIWYLWIEEAQIYILLLNLTS